MDTRRLDGTVREWFAVQVWAGREALSARHLQQRGYDIFLPRYREHRQWSDRVKKVDRALFAGYVFCRASAEVVGKLTTSPGVVRVVGDQQGPLPIADEEIETIQRIVETRLMVEPISFLRKGQRVRVETGPLRGAEGVVLMSKGRHRLVVSIELLQRSVAVEIDPDWVGIPYSALLQDAAIATNQP